MKIIIFFLLFSYPVYSDFTMLSEKLDSGTVFPIFNESIQLVREEIICDYKGLPFATSSHPNDKWGNYTVDSAFDGDISTAWVEGVEGAGYKERVLFLIPPNKQFIKIFPGYGKKEVFKINNRLHYVKIHIYHIKYTTEIENYKFLYTIVCDLKDKMEYQIFKLGNLGQLHSPYNHYMGIFDVDSLYRGRDPDTCISEIQFE